MWKKPIVLGCMFFQTSHDTCHSTGDDRLLMLSVTKANSLISNSSSYIPHFIFRPLVWKVIILNTKKSQATGCMYLICDS